MEHSGSIHRTPAFEGHPDFEQEQQRQDYREPDRAYTVALVDCMAGLAGYMAGLADYMADLVDCIAGPVEDMVGLGDMVVGLARMGSVVGCTSGVAASARGGMAAVVRNSAQGQNYFHTVLVAFHTVAGMVAAFRKEASDHHPAGNFEGVCVHQLPQQDP